MNFNEAKIILQNNGYRLDELSNSFYPDLESEYKNLNKPIKKPHMYNCDIITPDKESLNILRHYFIHNTTAYIKFDNKLSQAYRFVIDFDRQTFYTICNKLNLFFIKQNNNTGILIKKENDSIYTYGIKDLLMAVNNKLETQKTVKIFRANPDKGKELLLADINNSSADYVTYGIGPNELDILQEYCNKHKININIKSFADDLLLIFTKRNILSFFK